MTSVYSYKFEKLKQYKYEEKSLRYIIVQLTKETQEREKKKLLKKILLKILKLVKAAGHITIKGGATS